MTPSRVPVTSEGPALAPALAFASEVIGTFDKWLEENRGGEFLGPEDVVEIVRFFLDGDRPHRVAYAFVIGDRPQWAPDAQIPGRREVLAEDNLALEYGPGSSYRGRPIPSVDVALNGLPYADVWAERCAQEALGEAEPMKAALAAYSESGDTPFCPLLDAREEA